MDFSREPLSVVNKLQPCKASALGVLRNHAYFHIPKHKTACSGFFPSSLFILLLLIYIFFIEISLVTFLETRKDWPEAENKREKVHRQTSFRLMSFQSGYKKLSWQIKLCRMCETYKTRVLAGHFRFVLVVFLVMGKT